MSTYLKTAAITAVILTSTFGAAFAAGAGNNESMNAPGMNVRYHTHDNAMMPSMGRMHGWRLHRVLDELRTDAARAKADRHNALLTQAQYRALKSENARIRENAIHIAKAHNGRIPLAQYTGLQKQIRHLGHDITHMA